MGRMAGRDRHPLITGAWVTSLGTLTSRVLGMVRDVATAALLGLSGGGVMDAFVIAFRIPNLFRRLFGEGALAAAYLPVFTARLEEDRAGAWQLVSVGVTWLTALLAVALTFGAVLAQARDTPPKTLGNLPATAGASSAGEANNPGGDDDSRLREGTDITDRVGSFRMAADRVAFFTEDGRGRFVGLENLNLERVARVIAGGAEDLKWKVTGSITEYEGSNYLLVRRAVLLSQPLGEDNDF